MPLFQDLSGAISSELALPLPFTQLVNGQASGRATSCPKGFSNKTRAEGPNHGHHEKTRSTNRSQECGCSNFDTASVL